jgi:hypothetical protein
LALQVRLEVLDVFAQTAVVVFFFVVVKHRAQFLV